MSVAVKTIPKRIATIAIGSCSGSDTYQNFFRPVAPSIAAASSTSCGIDAMPARKITVANGIVRHACTKMIEPIAARSACRATSAWSSGRREVQLDEEPGEDARLRVVDPEEADRGERDRRRPRQQDHEAEDPAAAGTRGRARARSGRRRATTIACEIAVKRNVCQIASTKIGSFSSVPEVPEPDPLAAERARGRVGEAEVDREHERRADERADEEHGRRDQQRREEAAALRQVPEPRRSAPPRGRDRCHRSAANVTRDCRESEQSVAGDRARAADEGLRRRHARRPRARPRRRGRRVRRLRRPVRLRQDVGAADDRRARGHHRRARCASAGRS